MVRFANSGSDLETIRRIFQALYVALEPKPYFTLDDMSLVLAQENLGTSNHHTGEKALKLAYRDDRSRDGFYNNSKMYSEIFRLLGWISPLPAKKLEFRFSWLGSHIYRGGEFADGLVRESILGIVFPNSGVDAKGGFNLRPFATILNSMIALDGLIYRDEMIIGPLAMENDTSKVEFKKMIGTIAALRERPLTHLQEAVEKLSKSRKIQVNTLHNYTRFPLSTLSWSGWTEDSTTDSYYGKALKFKKLTPAGIKMAGFLSKAADIRLVDLTGQDSDILRATSVLGALQMVDRAGFDVSPLTEDVENSIAQLTKAKIIASPSQAVLFSPFQVLAPNDLESIFSGRQDSPSQHKQPSPQKNELPSPSKLSATKIKLMPGKLLIPPPVEGPVSKLLQVFLAKYYSPKKSSQLLVSEYKDANKQTFYPAVVEIFRILKYDCRLSRAGVNYERWDAFIEHPSLSVPIEIKSPGEELFISVKGVRQALENKVILTARKYRPSRKEATSLVVGFMPPNDRADVADLITDIYLTFGVRIGVIDFESIATLAANTLAGKIYAQDDLLKLKGFINVDES